MAGAGEAAAYARAHPGLSVGLHLDLGEWQYARGDWRGRYAVVDTDDAEAVEAEVGRQIDAFHRLLGRHPTHLDSHQHVHRNEPVRSALRRAGDRLGVPVRHHHAAVRYRGDFYGQDARGWSFPQAITVAGLVGACSRPCPTASPSWAAIRGSRTGSTAPTAPSG